MEDYRYRFIHQFAPHGALEQNPDDESDPDDDDDQNPVPDSRNFVPVNLGVFQDNVDEEEEDGLFPVVRLLPNGSNGLNGPNRIEDEDEDYEDEDYEDDDDNEEDYEDEEEEEELEELFPAVNMATRSVGVVLGGMVVNDDGNDDDGVVEEDSSGGSELCEGKFGNGENKCGGEFHGSFCPICFEAWTSGGEHQICCLPCGHIYGLSCIKKWLQQSPSSGKCPQCNNICTLKDVRVLYASRLCVADEELQKRVRSLEAKCAYLEQKAGPLTPDELIDQICSNPAAVQRLAKVLAGLTQQPVSP
ncbi:uncharacterized protein LOC143606326 [Bidens hawaiensis]|uniref:uncharacterized protein LOC143606326 n=1 Tax=Bidens hawaiensis TaxID=980011 RepID=UPI00404A5724